jgi:hypothetical protein
MKMRFSILLTLMLLVLACSPVWADHAGHAHDADHAQEAGVPVYPEASEEQAPIVVEPNQAVAQVHGIVCSFCAYGVEKKLSKLKMVDTGRFSKGIFTDIGNQRLTIALLPGAQIDHQLIGEAIQQAGYEWKTIWIRGADKEVNHFTNEAQEES